MADVVLPVAPVEVAVVGFPETSPDKRVTAAVAESVASGVIRVLDALVIEKAEDGTVNVIDVENADDALDLLGYPTDVPGLLTEDDASGVADGLPNGTSAVIIAWEDIWALKLRSALAEAGGVIAMHERISPEDLAVAVETFAVAEILDDQMLVDEPDEAVAEEDFAAESVEEK